MTAIREGAPPAGVSDLALRAWTSRRLGSDPDLVLYGGGNTSLKAPWRDPGGSAAEALYVKGSGSDLAEVTEADFTPLALAPVRALLDGPPLDNAALMATLEPLKLDPLAPRPSIETLLHACLPHRWVEHTHADAILAVIDTANGPRIAARVFGSTAPLVPFRHSGFDLALACREVFRHRGGPDTVGLLLHRHGAVSFADDSGAACDAMLGLVQRARAYLESRGAWELPRGAPPRRSAETALVLARLRSDLAETAGFRLLLSLDTSPVAMGFVQRPDVSVLADAGPATPQHAVFTRGCAQLGTDVADWSRRRRQRVRRHLPAGWSPAPMPDAAPRIVLDPRFGIAAAGVDSTHAGMALEVFRHGFAIASRAAAHDRFRGVSPRDALLAELHYGGFEGALLERAQREAPLTGAVAVVAQSQVAGLAAGLTALGCSVVPAGGDHAQAIDTAALEACWTHGGVDVVIAHAAAAGGGFAADVLDAAGGRALWASTSGPPPAADGRLRCLDARELAGPDLARCLADRLREVLPRRAVAT